MLHLLSTPFSSELGIFFIRVSLGLIFMVHGWSKVMGGTPTWLWMGSQMAHFGITFAPLFWGTLAMLTEFVGGFCLAVGFGTRLVSIALAWMMIVALSYHITKGDTFNDVWSHAFTLFFIFIGLAIAGSGKYSLDAYLFGGK